MSSFSKGCSHCMGWLSQRVLLRWYVKTDAWCCWGSHEGGDCRGWQRSCSHQGSLLPTFPAHVTPGKTNRSKMKWNKGITRNYVNEWHNCSHLIHASKPKVICFKSELFLMPTFSGQSGDCCSQVLRLGSWFSVKCCLMSYTLSHWE